MTRMLIEVQYNSNEERQAALEAILQHHRNILAVRDGSQDELIVTIDDQVASVWGLAIDDPDSNFSVDEDNDEITIFLATPFIRRYRARYKSDVRSARGIVYTCAICGKTVRNWEGSSIEEDARQHDSWCPLTI